MTTISDPIRDIFGPRALSELLRILAPVQEDILWVLEPHLGEGAIDAMRSAREPVKEILSAVRHHKANTELVADLKLVLNDLESVRPHLRIAGGANGPTSMPSSQVPLPNGGSTSGGLSPRGDNQVTRLKDLGWRRMTDVSEVRGEVDAVGDNGHATVLVFSDEKANPLSSSFCQELRALARQHQDNAAVRFAYVDLSQNPMADLSTRYSMMIQPPTTITIVNGGFWRTTGERAQEIESDIRKSLADLESVKIIARQTYPRPPIGWSVTRALRQWSNLPDSIEGVLLAARIKRVTRPTLIHVLPFIKDKAPDAHRIVAAAIRGTCGNFSRKGDVLYTCFTCQPEGSTQVDYCAQCFDRSDHIGHRYERRSAVKDDIYCDCGTMAGDKRIGVQCGKHKREAASSKGSSGTADGDELPLHIRMLLMMAMMNGMSTGSESD